MMNAYAPGETDQHRLLKGDPELPWLGEVELNDRAMFLTDHHLPEADKR
ncbi:hypothetical protein ACOJBO_02100 [Rhizobium beringeri]